MFLSSAVDYSVFFVILMGRNFKMGAVDVNSPKDKNGAMVFED